MAYHLDQRSPPSPYFIRDPRFIRGTGYPENSGVRTKRSLATEVACTPEVVGVLLQGFRSYPPGRLYSGFRFLEAAWPTSLVGESCKIWPMINYDSVEEQLLTVSIDSCNCAFGRVFHPGYLQCISGLELLARDELDKKHVT